MPSCRSHSRVQQLKGFLCSKCNFTYSKHYDDIWTACERTSQDGRLFGLTCKGSQTKTVTFTWSFGLSLDAKPNIALSCCDGKWKTCKLSPLIASNVANGNQVHGK